MNGPVSTGNEIIEVGAPLPRLKKATPLSDRLVRLMWSSGETKVVDLAPALASRRAYISLRNDDRLFRTLRVSEYGNAIQWDENLDFSAVWLDRLPSVQFDNASFRQAMDVLGLSLDGMAAQLEVSRRLVAQYRKDKPIPRHIALATQYLVERQGG
ncbi:MAG: DUF2442 domain-containing protein [Rhizobiaceae bacterium]|nr:DUF2442 domain-containing protein [Rhizobiaceae bacterium]